MNKAAYWFNTWLKVSGNIVSPAISGIKSNDWVSFTNDVFLSTEENRQDIDNSYLKEPKKKLLSLKIRAMMVDYVVLFKEMSNHRKAIISKKWVDRPKDYLKQYSEHLYEMDEREEKRKRGGKE